MAGVALRVTSSSIAASLLLASLAPPCCADPAPIIHYAPGENLEHVDVALIDRAEQEIDMAAYVLTDWAASASSRSHHSPNSLENSRLRLCEDHASTSAGRSQPSWRQEKGPRL